MAASDITARWRCDGLTWIIQPHLMEATSAVATREHCAIILAVDFHGRFPHLSQVDTGMQPPTERFVMIS